MAATSTATDPTPGADPFLRLMSHEMRTPLNGVIGMLGLLSRTPLDDAQRDYLKAAQGSAEHLLGLVNDLLDYARLEAGKLEFDLAPVALDALVGGVAELLSPRAHDKGLEIAWSVGTGVPPVLADEGRLRQVLFNLAGNAVKFTGTGAVALSVARVGGPDARPLLDFIVDDTGPGVPIAARARIFEEFGHVDASDATRFGGAGLGLAVVRRLAEAMGGEVSVEDRPADDGQGGSRFRFRAAFDAAPVQATAPPRLIAGLMVAMCAAHPFVAGAAAAPILAAGGRIRDDADLILIDHALAAPGARVAPPAGARAVVLLRPSERDLIAAYRADGFAGYLIKPLRPASLIARLLAVSDATAPATAPSRRAPALDDDRIVTAGSRGVRVLLAEDNPVGALLAQTLLRREGCEVETAATGAEAVAALARARFDLVLMDMRMPGMDGPAAARRVRAAGDRTPILALTANAFAEDRRACLDAGMDDHLVKPLAPEALRAALARWTKPPERAKVA